LLSVIVVFISVCLSLWVWLIDNIVGCIDKVALYQDGLVLVWVYHRTAEALIFLTH